MAAPGVLLICAITMIILGGAVLLPAGSDASRYADARRVIVRALVAELVLFAICCAYIAGNGLDGALGIWPAIIFIPGWFLFALLIPLWTDSPTIRTTAPAAGWQSALHYKLFYRDANDGALWVYMRPQNIADARSALYTPNLGHRWGQLAAWTFVVLVCAMIALLIATSHPTSLAG